MTQALYAHMNNNKKRQVSRIAILKSCLNLKKNSGFKVCLQQL
jgi:hypothetical protein